MLIINADDWGASISATSRIEECVKAGVIDTVSAMVYMKDSRRAVRISKNLKIDTALHLNFTAPFDGDNVPKRILESQLKIISYLKSKKSAQFIYNRALHPHFDYVYKAQYDEYCELFGSAPQRIDGHNHMHLCANMLAGKFIPAQTRVRRNIHFIDEKKSILNRAYRSIVDLYLTKRYYCTDYFLHIHQFMREDSEKRTAGLKNLAEMSKKAEIELLVHPHQTEDYEFVMSDEFKILTNRVYRAKTAHNY
ncbi:MAG: ChbG/HpnK family deacetylase [Chitinispirillia bacterium]|nr:ChbG/HpnK family deacetylase [Chitinispirillia bacterium]